MRNDIAQFLWVEGRLSTLERLCLSSFRQNNYDVHLYTYKKVQNIPGGIKILPAAEILPEELVFQNRGVDGSLSSYTALSDLFRLELLFRKGGWWFDMDMICLQHLAPPADFLTASTWEGTYGECPCNCAIYTQQCNPRIEEMRDQARSLTKEKGSALKFGESGIFLLQAFINKYNLQSNVAPWYEFCPYPWRLIHRLAQRTGKAYAIDKLRGLKHRAWQMIDPKFKAAYPRK